MANLKKNAIKGDNPCALVDEMLHQEEMSRWHKSATYIRSPWTNLIQLFIHSCSDDILALEDVTYIFHNALCLMWSGIKNWMCYWQSHVPFCTKKCFFGEQWRVGCRWKLNSKPKFYTMIWDDAKHMFLTCRVSWSCFGLLISHMAKLGIINHNNFHQFK